MKKLIFIIPLLFFSFQGFAKKVIEHPPFNVRNNSTLEIERITITKKETKIDFVGYTKAGEFFSLSSGSYIRIGDNMFRATKAENIEFNAPAYKKADEEVRFSLIFPPIDEKTERFDFIERGSCETCFKIFGIETHSGSLKSKTNIPETIKQQAIAYPDHSPLKTPELKQGTAILKGQLYGYVPELGYEAKVMYTFPITNEWYSETIDVASDGKFDFKMELQHEAQLYYQLSSIFQSTIILSPGETSELYIDLPLKNCQTSRIHTGKCTDSKSVFFAGANADINNQYADYSLTDFINDAFDYRQMIKEIAGMSATEYKDYILAKKNEAVTALKDKPLLAKVKELAEINIGFKAMSFLTAGEYILQSAAREAGNTLPADYRVDITVDYFDFLKDSPINNPKALYDSNYGAEISNCTYFTYRFRHLLSTKLDKELIGQLKKLNTFTDEENKLVEYIISLQPENWEKAKVNKFKSDIIAFVDDLLMYKDLSDVNKNFANEILSMAKSPGNNVGDIHPKIYLLTQNLYEDSGSETELQILSSIFNNYDNNDPTQNEKIDNFFNKYQSDIDFLVGRKLITDNKKLLAELIGTNKGIIFDLMSVQSGTRQFEENTPISTREITLLREEIQNPFFYNYIEKGNNNLIAELERKRARGDFQILKLPETEEDKILYEIIKPFEGKVILIDFWETWCGPCRSAMKQFEPYKETFADKDVVFIYLASESSPQNNWENMVTDIKGTHYRLTKAQSGYLNEKFGIRGVPSYLILSKTGEQVYFKVGFEGAERISGIINDELAK